jgi:hypothetical protein
MANFKDIGCSVPWCTQASTIYCNHCPCNPNYNKALNKLITIQDFTTEELLAELKRRVN